MANIEKYEGFPITFENKNGKMMVNATQMAKPFEGKTVSHWLSNNRTTELIACKSADSGIPTSELVVVVKGGEPSLQGTWLHEDLAIPFAQWLSPKFYIWCNDHIKELLKTGSTSLNLPTDYETALEQLLVKVKENKRLALENQQQTQYIAENQAHVDFAKQVGVSVSSISMEEFSKELFKKYSFEIGKNKAYEWFRQQGYLTKNNLPYQRWLNKGYFEVQKVTTYDKRGNARSFPLTFICDAWVEKLSYEIMNYFNCAHRSNNGLF